VMEQATERVEARYCGRRSCAIRLGVDECSDGVHRLASAMLGPSGGPFGGVAERSAR
jgi:hypothetical protein